PSAALTALEQLDHAFVLIANNFVPIYLSRRAALLLGIRDRSEPANYLNLFHELLNVTKLAARRSSTNLLATAKAPLVRRVTLRSETGRVFDAIAHPKAVSGADWKIGEHQGAHLLSFRDTSYLESFFHMLEQSRRLRPMLIFASCVSGRDINSIHASGESVLRSLIADDDVPVADLQQNISRAVDIADPLVPPSVKIVIEMKSAVLLQIPAMRFTRLIAHMILEGADFIGLNGEIRLRMEETKTSEKRASGEHSTSVGVLIAATRKPLAIDSPDMLDNYILRRLLPNMHKVTVSDNESTGVAVSLHDVSRKHGVKLREETNHAVSPESLSENGTICLKLAEEVGASVSFKKPNDNVLALHLKLPLATDIAPFASK
ncbi:MAG: hypothetical protein KDD66_07005, partial [Bdellovibrionales bacterium]|nr:hypothetical protein [Bdellovibrionales bacterium]